MVDDLQQWGADGKLVQVSAGARRADVAAMVYRLRARSGGGPVSSDLGIAAGTVLTEALYESAKTGRPAKVQAE